MLRKSSTIFVIHSKLCSFRLDAIHIFVPGYKIQRTTQYKDTSHVFVHVILKVFYPLVLMLLSLHKSSISFHLLPFRQSDVAASWRDYILANRFTLYALPLADILKSAFGSDSRHRVPA